MLSSRTRAMWMGSTQQPAYVVKRVELCVADDGSASAHIAHCAQFVIGSAFCACSADRAAPLLPLSPHPLAPSTLSSLLSHPIPPPSTPHPRTTQKKRVGRGPGSGRGKTAGRGMNGQKARSGRNFYTGFEGGQTPLYIRMPKVGHNNGLRKPLDKVNVDKIESYVHQGKIDNTQTINLKRLYDSGEW